MARQHVIDASDLAHRGVEGVDGGAGHPEGDIDALLAQHVNGSFRGGHASHDDSSSGGFYSLENISVYRD
jgi:hypothetical protein